MFNNSNNKFILDEPNAHDHLNMIYNAVAQMIPFELEIGEILVNGQQWIHNTVEHTDSDNGISWIYYVNREWREEWGGETVIKLDGEWKKFICPDVFSYLRATFPSRTSNDPTKD